MGKIDNLEYEIHKLGLWVCFGGILLILLVGSIVIRDSLVPRTNTLELEHKTTCNNAGHTFIRMCEPNKDCVDGCDLGNVGTIG
jgi:hypothetical protein